MSSLKRSAAWSALLISALWLPATLVAATSAAADPAQTVEPRPLRVVILVDESGSLSPADVTAEQHAAALIALSEFSPSSQVAVVGFGSSNGPGQSPVDVVCPMTRVDSQLNRDSLAGCVRKLHRRTPNEGDDTDFANAFNQALSLLATPDATDHEKVIFLMTDGALDVEDSPSWGAIKANRNDAARAKMDEYLDTARTNGIQVWPLGFGSLIDRSQLEAFAAAGSQQTCRPDAPKPASRVVSSQADVAYTMLNAFAAAGCRDVVEPVTRPLPTGHTVDLFVDVPAITTDGSIAVVKHDPRISVSYFAPGEEKAVSKAGRAGGSEYSVSGENSPVEVLRIRNPLPGRWRVQLISGPDVPAQNVTATVIWQGNIRSDLTVRPPQPQAGESVTVSLTIRTRARLLTDRAALSSLQVGVQLTGSGFTPVLVPVHDDGKGPDTRAGDGEYNGTIAVPSTAAGDLTFTSVVSGPGIADAHVPFHTTIPPQPRAVAAGINLTVPERVTPGGGIEGTIVARNTSAAPATVRISLSDFDEGTVASLASAATVEIGPSAQIQVPLHIVFGGSTRRGWNHLVVAVVDARDPAVQYDVRPVTVNVQPPPGWSQRYRWPIIAAGALTVLLIAALAMRAVHRRRRLDARGLVAMLYRDGRETWLRAPDTPSREFRFIIRDEASSAPRLDAARDSDDACVLRRRPDGLVDLQTPSGIRAVLPPETPEPIGNGLGLAYRDERSVHLDPWQTPDTGADGTAPGRPEGSSDQYDDLLS